MKQKLKAFSKSHKELWKFIKFNFTLITTSALDIILYFILLYFVFRSMNADPLPQNAILSLLGIKYKGYLFSYLISTSAGYIAAYIMNRKITFHSDINAAYSSVLYFALAVFNIVFSSWIGGIAGSFMKANAISNPITEAIAKFIIINIPTIWTYPLERYVIQIKRKGKKNCLIASDLDGTLLSSDTNVSRENLNAVEFLTKKGCTVALVTGRTFYEIPQELRDCSGINYFVYSNGAGIFSKKDGTIYSSPIKRETALELFQIINKYDTFIELYCDGAPIVDAEKFSDDFFNYYEIDKDFLPEMHKSRVPVESFFSYLSDNNEDCLEMFDVFFKSQSERSACKKEIKEKYPEIEITTSMTNNLEIMNKGINKGTGLERLCRELGISTDSVIALGDSKNDLTFFKKAGKRYAVSNACKELKEISDKIICSNNEHVMQYMLKEIKNE